MSLPEGYAVRRASIHDINTLAAHRRAMFADRVKPQRRAILTVVVCVIDADRAMTRIKAVP
jgi:hypothetical protein